MFDLALLVLRSVAALFVFFTICAAVKHPAPIVIRCTILVLVVPIFLWLCTLSTWALWLIVAGAGLFVAILLFHWIAGKRALKTNELTDEEMRQFAEKTLPRPYTEEEIQVRRRFPLGERSHIYLWEGRRRRFFSEDEMLDTIKEAYEYAAKAAERAAEQAESDRKSALEEKAAEKVRAEMKLPKAQCRGTCWKVHFDSAVEFRKSDGTALTLPSGTHELSLSCQFEAPEDADYYPKIPSELSVASVPTVQGEMDLVTLLDLFNIGHAFWWRDQGAQWQKSFQSNVVLGNVGCVEDVKEQLLFKAGKEEVSVYFRRSSYVTSLAVVEDQLWARVHALQHIDEDANYHSLAPFCFPVKAASLLKAWNQEEDIIPDGAEVN